MEILRHSTVGHVARFLTRDRILSYPNEQVEFEHAIQSEYSRYQAESAKAIDAISGIGDDIESSSSIQLEKTRSISLHSPKKPEESVLVGWFAPNDVENPQNWSNLKRYSVGLLIW
jgi:DHA1 family multidrug resistance protein-like MFS transporter